jgi:pyridoxal phosphate enzyme (YggS family)
MEASRIGENVQSVMDRVRAASARAGRGAGEIAVVAVSKFHSAEEVSEAYRAGLRLFGENRVQEAQGKFPALMAAHADIGLHMLGHLQSNKAKAAAGLFSCVQSLDSIELGRKLSKAAVEGNAALEVFCEVHTGEESKSGFRSPDELWACLDGLRSLPGIVPAGLMTMAPFTSDEAPIRASFRALAALAKDWSSRHPDLGPPILSMGMSNDYEIAIEEGSTMLRIGTAFFGERGA